jgi:hypothetical protein
MAANRGSSARPALRLTWDQVLAWRMRRQFVDPVGDAGAVDIASRLCGVQAQVASAAQLAVALRQRTPPVDEVRQALADRALFKTWAMRGTLHLLAVHDGPDYLALLASGRTWLKPAWQKAFITAAQLDKLTEAVIDLVDGQVLGRTELVAGVLERTGDKALADQVRSGWSAVLKPLAWQGYLCNGPSDGTGVTFTRPDTWLPTWPGLPATEEAARRTVRAYLGAYGPASLDAFSQWLSRGVTSRTTVRRWFADLGDELVSVEVEGTPAYARASDVDDLAASRPRKVVRLLPGFDQFVLGPGTGDPQVIAPHRRSAISKTAGWISPVLLVDGRVGGTWTVSGSDLSVAVFSETRSIPETKLRAEAARVGERMGQKLTLVVTVD